ncbi:bifunctional DNA primase/polymerase [Streptomyces sp. DT2A-34]|uniref:bifunctional DNA primase/polymerase n=1 Tax=Streptomyces sp. DT2A-34 TaxID=3051182 RepID=UPI00265C317F|nr:bifunctional DNA primase/polymerase [Streptomyces sp. DT2A-34]MDO0911159.1 bifunctional DNA primase/polymerase [Streptomyces sp. DT2A-34]
MPLVAAVAYAQRGWRVIPAPYGSKYPTMKGWPNEATHDDWNKIVSWFPAGPQTNVCIVTGEASNLWVLDVDDGPGKIGSATLAALEAKIGQFPATYTVKTRTGGLHFYWTWDGVDFDLRNSAGKLGPDLDTRGNGGQVVAPPSWAAADDSGPAGFYEVCADDAPVAAPAKLVDMLRPKVYVPTPKTAADSWMDDCPFSQPCTGNYEQHDTPGGTTAYALAALASECDGIISALNGTQNDTINKAAFSIAGLFKGGQLGSDEEWVKAQLLEACIQGNHPEWRARRTIESGWEKATPRAAKPRPNMNYRRV